MKLRAAALTLAVAVMITAAGCGNDDPPPPQTTPEAPFTPDAPTPEEEPPATPTETPAPEPQTYEVEQGDTLSGIAQRFGVSVQAIVDANDIEDPDSIFPGDVLQIPDE